METGYKEYKDKVDRVIAKYRNKNAATFMRSSGREEKISFGRLGRFISSAETKLRMYLRPGDRAALLSPLTPYSVMTAIALTYSGITVVPIDITLPAEEIKRLIGFSDVRAVFITEKLCGFLDSKAFKAVQCFRLGNGLGIVPFEKAEKIYSHEPTSDPETDVAAIIYSSGTTGQMKGVKVTYRSIITAQKVVQRLIGFKAGMKYLLVLPFNHIAGFTSAMTYFLTGCEIGYIEDVDASKLQSGLQKFQPHYFVMIPKVYEVMEQKIRAAVREKGKLVYGFIMSMLRLSGVLRKNFGINIGRKAFHGITKQVFGENIVGLGTGASPCKPETAEFFLNLGIVWANFYASTETNVPIAATGIYDRYPADTVGNVGRHPEIRVKINAPDANGIGEITVRSQLMMKGYFRRPDLTRAAFENGYFKTGDYGYIDKAGYLHITGRIKESIVLRNGKKVSPSDVDDYYLERIPEHDIASRGITDENNQYDEIHLFIADEGFSAAQRKAVSAAYQKASRSAPSMYKLSSIHFIPEIQRTSVGKVKRFSLSIDDEIRDDIVRTDNPDSGSKTGVSETVYKCIRSLLDAENKFIISDDMRLKEDLGMESLDVFDLCVCLDEKYGTELEAALYEGISVGDIIRLTEQGASGVTTVNDASAYPLSRTEKDRRAFRHFMKISRFIWDIRVSGGENISKDETYIFCPNHQCHFDGMWVIGSLDERIRNNICSVAADYLFEQKIFRKGVIFMGGIPVHRTGNTATAMKRAQECIANEGYNLLIHPEGTRTSDGRLGEFKPGAAKLAIDSGIKIIPVCIDGAFNVFPRQRALPRIFDFKNMKKYRVNICFGKPISPSGKTEQEITNEIKRKIIEMRSEIRKEKQ
ncbi:MAG: AMP-binding protein [Alistipes sp.]|nr:AMP-binding protein [Alistipes sp.]